MNTLPKQRTPELLDLTPVGLKTRRRGDDETRRYESEPPVTIWNVTKMVGGALLLGCLALAVIILAGGFAR